MLKLSRIFGLVAVLAVGLLLAEARAGTAPTAANQSVSVVTGGEVAFYLSITDPDTSAYSADMTVSIVSSPAHGTLESYHDRYNYTGYNNYLFYRPAAGYVGSDSFTWKCFDGTGWSNVATCSITVKANTVPVASNSSVSVNSNTRSSCYMSVTDPDAGQTKTYTLVTAPAHGTVEPISTSNYAYYTSAPGYVGTDSFQWKVSDGMATSNTATVTITVNAVVPAPQNQTAMVTRNTAADIPAAYSGGGGYTVVVKKKTDPAHGTLTISGTTFHYVPAAGYEGGDSFTWYMTYSGPSSGTTATVTCSIWVLGATDGNWTTFRGDKFRSAVTPQSLPATLYRQWTRDFNYRTDAGTAVVNFEPVVEGKTLVICGGNTDKVFAVNTDTGALKWTYFADGPVRTAPVITGGRVYAASDDGYLHCLNASTGALLWKKLGGPSNRKVFGDRRMISSWPLRAGPLAADGRVHFVAGLWPIEGIFAYGLDAATGAELWCNTEGGVAPAVQPHSGVVAAGICPQGYLVCDAIEPDRMYVPSTRAMPGVFSRSAGTMENWIQDKVEGRANVDSSGASLYSWPVSITTPAKTWTASDVAALGATGSVVNMAMADGKLFAVTSSGRIWCFGPAQVASPAAWTDPTTPLPTVSDAWTSRVSNILSTSGAANGLVLVMGIGDGRVVEELVKQTTANVHVVAIDPDAGKVAALRAKLDAAKLYGTRVSVHAGDPLSFGLPPYVGRLIVVADPAAAGISSGQGFAEKLFFPLRPYGGQAWLLTTSAQHTSLSGWVSSAGLANATVTRTGEFSVLSREGALPGSVEFKSGGTAGTKYDELVTGPFGVLWFDSCNSATADGGHWGTEQPAVADGMIIGAQATVGTSTVAYDVYSGMPMPNTAWPGRPGTSNVPNPSGMREPLFGFVDAWDMPWQYGCGSTDGNYYGNINGRRSGCIGYSDRLSGNRVVHVAGARAGCGGTHIIPANGVMAIPGTNGCGCAYPLSGKALTLVHRDDVEVWASWGEARIGRTLEEEPVKKVGINFGAPGERVDEANTLWIHQPTISGPNPDLAATFEPADPERFYQHMSRIASAGSPAWVAASGIKFAGRIRIPLTWTATARSCSAAPAIDGQLGDACWDGVAPTDLIYERNAFSNIYGVGTGRGVVDKSKSARNTGQVWLRYDAQNLYLACTTQGNFTDSYAPQEKWSIFLSDRSKLLYGIVDRCARFSLTWAGTREDGISTLQLIKADPRAPEDTSWDGSWSGAVTATATAFDAEFALPWSTIQAAGLDPAQLVVNIRGPEGIEIRNYDGGYNQNYKFVPLSIDAPSGLAGATRSYNVRLHFAEPEAIAAGQRVFDVKLQGATVLSNFDVVAQAGGSRKAVVKDFSNVQIKDELDIDLVARTGQPVICGAEILGNFSFGNHPPEIAVDPASPYTMTAGTSKQFRLTSASDPDGDSLSYSWKLDGTAITSGIVSASYYVSGWTYAPTAANVGVHTLQASASDGKGGVASYTWTIYVTGGMAPKITSPLVAEAVVGKPFSYTIAAAGDTPITFGASGRPAWLAFDGTAALSGTPTSAGTFNIGLSASNASGSDSKTLTVKIIANQPPVARITAWPTTGGAGLKVYFDGSASYDPDGVVQLWEWDYGDGVKTDPFSLSGASRGGPIVNHTYSTEGVYTATLTVTDPWGAKGSAAVAVTITATGTNRPPTAFDASVTTPMGVAKTITLSASDQDSGTTLIYSIVSNPAHGTVSTGTTRTRTYTPAAGYIGPDSFTFKVNDGQTDSNVAKISIMVTGANSAPMISSFSPANPVTVAAGTTQPFNVDAWDADGDALSYAWKLDGVSVPVTLDVLNYSPVAADAGTHTIQVTVSDGKGGTAAQTWNVTVTAPSNNPPVASLTGPVNGATFTAPASIAMTASASDSDGTVAKVEFYQGATKLGEDTTSPYSFSWTNVAAGSYTLTARAIDNLGATATSAAVSVTVTAAAVAPTITTQPASKTVTVGQTATFSVVAGGTAPLSYQWRKNGANISGATSSSYTTPATSAADSGSLFSVVVTNSAGSATSGNATLTVTVPTYTITASAGTGGTISPSGSVVVSQGANQSFTITANGGYQVAGVTADGSSVGAVSSYAFTNVTANHTIAATFSAVVVPPSVTSQPASKTVTAGQTATFSVAAGGTAPLSYQWRKNGTTISGATSASYTTPATTTADSGSKFSVVVSNSAGSATSNDATLTVNPPAQQAPTVALTSPVDGAVYSPTANIALAATASDADGSVTKVEFYQGSTLLYTDTTAPYSYTWSKVNVGTYTFTAKAYDNAGLSTTSAAATVKVLPVVTVSASDAWASEPSTDKGSFKISRTGATTAALTVKYSVSGTATNGTDYQTLTGTATIAAGSSYVYVYVTPIDDTLVEAKESVVMTLSTDAAYTLGTAKVATVNLLDNEMPVVTVSVTDSWAAEPGTDHGQFKLSRTGATTAALTVRYAMSGTAANGTDYASLSGSAIIPAGATYVYVDVAPQDDSLVENKETVILTVSENAAYQTGSTISGTVNLLDNEVPIVTVAATDGTAAEPSDTGTFTITRAGKTDVAVTVNYAMSGTATKGTDYATPSGSVTLAAGVTAATVTIAPIDDTTAENREYATLAISSNAAYQTGSPSSATVYLYDDEKPYVSVAATDSAAAETNSDVGRYTITCLPAPKAATTVAYTMSGTATNGSDYATLSGSAVFAAGQSTAVVTLTPVDDGVYEGTESAKLTIAAGTTYQVGSPSYATVNIADNEPTVSVSRTDSTGAETLVGATANTGNFRITRSNGLTTAALTVAYTMSGTATNGTDYVQLPGSATIPAGATYVDILVTPKDDSLVEGSETVIMTLTASSAFKMGTASSTVTIYDND